MSAGKGFGKLESPEVYSPLGVISIPSGPFALRMSMVAESEAIAIQTLPIARNRPGQMLLYVAHDQLTDVSTHVAMKRTGDQNRTRHGGIPRVVREVREGSVRA